MSRRHVLAATLAVLATASSPTARGDERVSQAREVTGTFSRIRVGGPFDVTVREGSPAAVVVQALPADQEKVNVEVKGDTLVVGSTGRWTWGGEPERGAKPVVTVTLPELRGLDVSGSGDARAETGPAARDLGLSVGGSGSIAWKGVAATLALAVSGSGDVKAEGPSRKLDVKVSGSGDVAYSGTSGAVTVAVSGSGDVKLAGEAESLDVSTAGSGDVEAGGFAVRDAKVAIAGSGDAALRLAGGGLTTRIAGSGDVVWTGEARSVDAKTSGSGSVTRR
jgi:hypothetical protein